MTSRGAWLAVVSLLPAGVAADERGGSYVQPSFSLSLVSEQGSGTAYAPPADDLTRPLAVSVGAGLDGRGQWGGGGLDWSALAFVHDPADDENRGVFAAARARGWSDLGAAWRLRFDASGRLQRRETATLSDFERSDVSLGIDRKGDGATLGLRVADRRRWVRESTLGFDRQSVLASATWGAPGGHRWRVEAGPQSAHAPTAQQWRLSGAVEWAGGIGSWTAGVRATWLEPLGVARGPDGTAGVPGALLPGAFPTPPAAVPTAPPVEPGLAGSAARTSSPGEGLLGPALIVDPLEDDENDWDIGLRKQQIVAVATRAFARTTITGALRVENERGPDLLSSGARDVERVRLAARLHVRHALGSRWALLAQGGWQRLDDDRPRVGYSHGLATIGIELRP